MVLQNLEPSCGRHLLLTECHQIRLRLRDFVVHLFLQLDQRLIHLALLVSELKDLLLTHRRQLVFHNPDFEFCVALPLKIKLLRVLFRNQIVYVAIHRRDLSSVPPLQVFNRHSVASVQILQFFLKQAILFIITLSSLLEAQLFAVVFFQHRAMLKTFRFESLDGASRFRQNL